MKHSLRYLRELTERLFKTKCPCPDVNFKDIFKKQCEVNSKENKQEKEIENVKQSG